MSSSPSLLALARRAVQENWREDQAQAEVTTAFPHGMDSDLLMEQIGPIADPSTTPAVADQIGRFLELLAGDHARKRGLAHAALVMAWMMRAQFGGDTAAWHAARRHFQAARLLLSDRDLQRMPIGMLETILQGDGRPLTQEQLPPEWHTTAQLLDALDHTDDRDAFLREHLAEFTDETLRLATSLAAALAVSGISHLEPLVEALTARVTALRRETGQTVTGLPDPLRRNELPSWMRILLAFGTQPGPPRMNEAAQRAWQNSVFERLLKAPDEAAFDRVLAERPDAFHPNVRTALDSLATIAEEEDVPFLAQQARTAHNRLAQRRVASPLDAALGDLLAIDDSAEVLAHLAATPILQGWPALTRLGNWANRLRPASEPAARELDELLCHMARTQYLAAPSAPLPAWVAHLQTYLVHRSDSLFAAVLAAAPADPPDLRALLRAFTALDTEAVYRLTRTVEAALWAAARPAEAGLIPLLWLDSLAGLVETYDQYALNEQAQALELGCNACSQAALLCETSGWPTGAAFYRAVRGSGLHQAGHTAAAEGDCRAAATVYGALVTRGGLEYRLLWANALTNLGHVLTTLQRPAEAVVVYEQAVGLARDLVPAADTDSPASAHLAAALNSLGGVYYTLRRYAAADAALQEAVDRLRAAANADPARYQPRLAATLTNHGVVLAKGHQLEDAVRALEAALELYRALGKAQPDTYKAGLKTVLTNLVGPYSALHRKGDAVAACRAAVALCRELAAQHPSAHEPQLAFLLNNLGVVLSADDQDEARAAHEEAIQRYRALVAGEPDRYRGALAGALNNLAALLLEQGGVTAAEAALREAAAIREALLPTAPAVYGPDLAQVLLNLAHLLRDTHRVAEALACYQRTVALDADNLEGARTRALRGWGVLLRRAGDLAGAYDRLCQARTDLEAARALLRRREDRRTFAAESGGIYRDLIDLCLERAATGDAAHWHTEAWHLAAQAKGRSLLELLQGAQPPQRSPAAAAVHKEWQATAAKLLELAEELGGYDQGTLPAAGTGSPESRATAQAALRAELAQTARAEHAARRRLIAVSDESVALLHADIPDPSHLASALCQLTKTDAAGVRPLLVDYYLLGGDRYVVFLLPLWQVTPDQPLPILAEVVTPPAGAKDTAIDLLFAGLIAARIKGAGPSRPESARDASAAPLDSTGLRALVDRGLNVFEELPARLGATYLAPWADRLAALDPTALVLVPSNALHLFPLHAGLLPDGTPLIERYPLVYLPNAALAPTLVRRRSEIPAPAGRLIMGPPGDDLPGAAIEAVALAENWDLTAQKQPYAGAAMTLARLRENADKVARIHLATHSTFDFNDYLQSAILFHNDRLTLAALISDPSLHFAGLRLIYLSSCESGFATLEAGDELQGLVWALTYAGAEAVMATLWPVDDAAAVLMAEQFYFYWDNGDSLHVAYRRALQALRAQYPNPYYWAPFVLVGNGF
ncbi:MAG: CHAT domain-containing protein [Chloroflexota bacterium]|nr:CHAT domain-containing protein [Chloroflexota bacterium]